MEKIKAGRIPAHLSRTPRFQAVGIASALLNGGAVVEGGKLGRFSNTVHKPMDGACVRDCTEGGDAELKEMSELVRRIGLFGGSFDPVHKAHVAVAREAVRQISLDGLIFLPAARSPLKSRGPVASGEVRMEMLRAVVGNASGIEISDWELWQSEPSYSWQTVEHFRKVLGPATQLFWVMGEDQWAQLEKWRRWEYLAAEVTFLVFSRDGAQPEPKPGVGAVFLDGSYKGSSTEVREARSRGIDSWKHHLEPEVVQIIERERLYL